MTRPALTLTACCLLLLTLTAACKSPPAPPAADTKPTQQAQPAANPPADDDAKPANNTGTVRKLAKAIEGPDQWGIETDDGARLCLPSGLYQHKGLELRFDPATVTPHNPNLKQLCQGFNSTTIEFVTPPKGRTTITATGVKDDIGTHLTYSRKYAAGPSATGLKTIKLCHLDLSTPEEGKTYKLTGYPHPDIDSEDCETWVLTAAPSK